MISELRKIKDKIKILVSVKRVEKAFELMINKKILLLFIVLLFQFRSIFALILNYNLSSIIPNFPEPNSNATAILCLYNDLYPLKLDSVYIYLNTSDSCIVLDRYEVYFNSIDRNACFPVNLNISNCSDGRYWIYLNGRYFVNGSIQTMSDYFLFTVYKAPNIVVNYDVSNNYIGREARIDLHITNLGGIVKDLIIYTNYSLCDIYTKEIYVGDLRNEINVSFIVRIPTYVSGSCNIPIILSYKDSMRNLYALPKLISFPVYSLAGRLTLSFDDIIIRPGEHRNITVYINNEGSMTFYNVLVRFNSLQGLSIDKQEVYIDRILPGEKKRIIIRIYPDINLIGLYNIPVNLSYTDEYGNKYSSVFSIPLRINEEPNISVSVWSSGNNLYVSVINFGNSNAKGVYIKVNCEGCILDRGDSFLGDIDANNYLTDNFRVLVRNNYSLIRIEVFYKDALGNVYTRSFTENINFIDTSSQQRGTSNIYIGILIVVVLIIVLIIILAYSRRTKG